MSPYDTPLQKQYFCSSSSLSSTSSGLSETERSREATGWSLLEEVEEARGRRGEGGWARWGEWGAGLLVFVVVRAGRDRVASAVVVAATAGEGSKGVAGFEVRLGRRERVLDPFWEWRSSAGIGWVGPAASGRSRCRVLSGAVAGPSWVGWLADGFEVVSTLPPMWFGRVSE